MRTGTILPSTLACMLAVFASAYGEPRDDNRSDRVASSNVRERIADFLDDAKGVRQHDFPAWNRFKEIAGDDAESRTVFRKILRNEAEISVAIGGSSLELARLVNYRLSELMHLVSMQHNQGAGEPAFEIRPASILAIAFAAADPLVAAQFDDVKGFSNLMRNSAEILYSDRQHLVLRRWSEPDKVTDIYRKVLGRWAGQKGPYDTLSERLELARVYHLDAAYSPLAWEILRNYDRPQRKPWSLEVTEFAVIAAFREAKKEDRRLLTTFLDDTCGLKSTVTRGRDGQGALPQPGFVPEVEDLALGAVIKVSGIAPEEYGLKKCRITNSFLTTPTDVYLYTDAVSRERGFAKLRANIVALGVSVPRIEMPKMANGFQIAAMSLESRGVKKSELWPAGAVKIVRNEHTIRLLNVRTGKSMGVEFDSAGTGTRQAFQFTCASFSPDGKYIVTGSRYYKPGDGDDDPLNYGRVEVWDAATGKRVAQETGRIGGILDVGFSEDGKRVYFEAERYSNEDP